MYKNGSAPYRGGWIELSDTESRKEIEKGQIEEYRDIKESEIRIEKEREQKEEEEQQQQENKRLEEAKKRQEEEEANRKFEREAQVIHSTRTKNSKITVYEYEGKYYLGERQYVQKRTCTIYRRVDRVEW